MLSWGFSTVLSLKQVCICTTLLCSLNVCMLPPPRQRQLSHCAMDHIIQGHPPLIVPCKLSHCSHVQLFATLWIVAQQAHCPWDSLGKNTGEGCHFLLQGIFLTQGWNPRLLFSCFAGGLFTAKPWGMPQSGSCSAMSDSLWPHGLYSP